MLRRGRVVVREAPRTGTIIIRTRAHCHAQIPTLALMAVALCVGCEKAPPRLPSADAGRPRTAAANPLENVLNPWLWTTTRDATDAEKALEDMGPYERLPGEAEAVNTNARYWTRNVG